MFARVSTFEGASEQVDELTRYADEQVLPALGYMDGFAGAFGLADRGSGKVLAMILWETEEAANRLRSETAEVTSDTVAGVERYEVTFAEVQETQF